MSKGLTIGGQAVIEGVMMKSDKAYSVAVRLENKRIFVKRFPFVPWTKKNKILGLPFIRGVLVLIDTLIIGIRCLILSANKAQGGKSREELSVKELVLTIIFSFVFVIALFKFLPLWLAALFQKTTHVGHFWFTLTDGILKIVIFLTYLIVISFMKDVRRLFEYHGAEHMAVHCYESGMGLSLRNVRKFPRAHARCGTSFILVVLFISILVYLFIPGGLSLPEKLVWRLILLPLVAGISYEFLKLGEKSAKQGLKLLAAPGLLIQGLTTRKPDNKQLEVAIRALKSVL